MNYKSKIVITSVISVVVTFFFTSALFLTLGSGILVDYITDGGEVSNALLSEVKMYIEKLYIGDVDENELYYGAAKGMAEATGDPYTKYYSPKEFEEYMESATGEYVGVGIVISADPDKNEIIVVLPYEDAPGAKAGILPGDIITAVDGVSYGSDTDAAADAMRGANLQNPAGTQVTLTIKRDGKEEFDTVLTREQIHLKTAASKMLEGDIGYMRLISFDADTDEEVEAELNSLINSGMKKLILDLRDNGGGDFNTCIRVAGKFLDEGKLVVYTQDKNGKREDFYAEGKITDCELILLINGDTASASEVLTGALSGNNRVKSVIGTKSFGKGITQNVFSLKNGGGMSVTVDRYFTPTGECIHEKGIMPDTVIESGSDAPSTTLSYDEDLQLQKAVEMFR